MRLGPPQVAPPDAAGTAPHNCDICALGSLGAPVGLPANFHRIGLFLKGLMAQHKRANVLEKDTR